MRTAIALILLLCALPAGAQDLRGQWDVETNNKQASGTILIDTERRATWDIKDSHGRTTVLFGYASPKGAAVEVTLTDRAGVYRLHCAAQSKELLHCFSHSLQAQEAHDGIILRRVGPGPAKLTRPP